MALPLSVLVAGCYSERSDKSSGGATCTIDVSYELSSAIPTVAIVTWTTDFEGVDSAYIEFGTDTTYGTVAPVALDEPSHRTLLLGMVPSRDYHFRAVATAGSSSCTSKDFTLTTGPADNGLSLPTVTTQSAAEVAPGFLLLSHFSGGGPDGGVPGGGVPDGGVPDGGVPQGGAGMPGRVPGGNAGAPSGMSGAGGAPGGMAPSDGASSESLIYVLNQDGDLVWWRNVPIAEVTRVLMSYDGKSMLALSLNLPGNGQGRMAKVSMDGLEVDVIPVPNGHHDFTVMPDGGLVFISKSEDDCDDLLKLASNGAWSQVYHVADAFDGELTGPVPGDACHTNSIHYNAFDDSFTFSVLNMNAYVKVSAAGALEWVLGGPWSQFSGDGAEWERQHGHQLLSAERLLFFSNGSLGSDGSLAIEVQLNPNERTAERVWSHGSDEASPVLGDVLRLANGNTLVAYSALGLMRQVNEAGAIVQELRWPIGGVFGYVDQRASLYGAPPH